MENIVDKGFRGCVLVVQEGRVIFERSYGYANFPDKVRNDLSTKFATASAGKVFVAVGILQLIENGLLRFDSKIGEVLDFDLKLIDRDITVEQLLTHTSGIPDYFDESVMDEYEDLWCDFPNYKIRSNQDLIPLFIDEPMMYPAGSKFQYNTTGFVVLALMIERITGMKFDHYLRDNIFIPCQMNDTGYYELDMLPANCAINYIYDEKRGGYRTNIFSVDAKGTGAGGAFTTVYDIRLFWENLLSFKLLSEPMTMNMLSNHSGEDACYGYGIWLEQSRDSFAPYFQGSDPGVSFISSFDIQRKLMLVLVSNYGDDVWKLREDILSRVSE